MIEREQLMREIKQRLEAAYGERLKGVVLYGSEARGEAGPDSDYDIMVLLEGPVKFGEELRRIIKVLYPVEHAIICDPEFPQDRPLDAVPVDVSEYEAGDYSLYRNVKREGIRL